MNRHYPIITQEGKEQILTLNDQGLQIADVAKRFNRSYWSMWHYFKDERIVSKFKQGRLLTVEELQEICCRYELEGWNLHALTVRFKTTREQIVRALEDHDVELRNKKVEEKYITDEDGERICVGTSYKEYLKHTYGKGYRKHLVPKNGAF